MMTDLTPERLKALTRIILQDRDADARKEALLEIRQSDHPKVIDLLQEVSRTDRDRSVRDLATNLLTKKRIEALNAPVPMYQPPGSVRAAEADGWACDSCGGQNPARAVACAFCGAERGGPALPVTGPQPAPAEAGRVHGPRPTGKIKPPGLFGGYGMHLVSAVIAVIFAVWFTGLTMQTREQNAALLERGVTTMAEITGKRIEEAASDDDANRHLIQYYFTVGGRGFRDGTSVTVHFYNRLQIGSYIEVVYLPDDPQVSYVPGTYDVSSNILTALMIAVNLGIGVIVIGLIVRIVRVHLSWRYLKRRYAAQAAA
jgi:hypothetical protein